MEKVKNIDNYYDFLKNVKIIKVSECLADFNITCDLFRISNFIKELDEVHFNFKNALNNWYKIKESHYNDFFKLFNEFSNKYFEISYVLKSAKKYDYLKK